MIGIVLEDESRNQVDKNTTSAEQEDDHEGEAHQCDVNAEELGETAADTGEFPVPSAAIELALLRGLKIAHARNCRQPAQRVQVKRAPCRNRPPTAKLTHPPDLGYRTAMGQRKTTPANRESIIQAASQLIRERGIDNTTLADIARAAEISKGTLYYYYATKGDLIFDIADRHMNRMTERIFRWLERSGTDQPPRTVYRMVLDTVMHSRSRGQMHVYLIQDALTENPSLRKRFVEEYRRWRGIIERGLARLYGEEGEYAIMSRVLLATIDGLVLQRLLGVEQLPIDEIAGFFSEAGNSAYNYSG